MRNNHLVFIVSCAAALGVGIVGTPGLALAKPDPVRAWLRKTASRIDVQEQRRWGRVGPLGVRLESASSFRDYRRYAHGAIAPVTAMTSGRRGIPVTSRASEVTRGTAGELRVTQIRSTLFSKSDGVAPRRRVTRVLADAPRGRRIEVGGQVFTVDRQVPGLKQAVILSSTTRGSRNPDTGLSTVERRAVVARGSFALVPDPPAPGATGGELRVLDPFKGPRGTIETGYRAREIGMHLAQNPAYARAYYERIEANRGFNAIRTGR